MQHYQAAREFTDGDENHYHILNPEEKDPLSEGFISDVYRKKIAPRDVKKTIETSSFEEITDDVTELSVALGTSYGINQRKQEALFSLSLDYEDLPYDNFHPSDHEIDGIALNDVREIRSMLEGDLSTEEAIEATTTFVMKYHQLPNGSPEVLVDHDDYEISADQLNRLLEETTEYLERSSLEDDVRTDGGYTEATI